jgi:hypothetical protein
MFDAMSQNEDTHMRFTEITAPPTHPELVAIRLDPVDLHRLRRLLDDDVDDAARIVHVDRTTPGTWRVVLACASARVRDALEDAWG